MNKTQVISQKSVYLYSHFEIKESSVILSNGEKRAYKDVFRLPAVSIFPITDFYELYLISQYRYLFRKSVLGEISGFIDKKETSLQAAKRELREEAGLLATQWEELTRIEISASFIKGQQHLFLAKDLQETKAMPEPSEEIKVVKMPLSNAVAKVMRGEIETSSSIIGILWLDELRREGKL